MKGPELEVAIKVTAVPAGWRSTEFWIVVAILAMAASPLGANAWSLLAAAVASVGYSLSRAKVKSLPWEALNNLGQGREASENCRDCADATGGVCKRHQEPECTCYEMTGGHQPGCDFNGRPLGERPLP